jgi:hypothetical protein
VENNIKLDIWEKVGKVLTGFMWLETGYGHVLLSTGNEPSGSIKEGKS